MQFAGSMLGSSANTFGKITVYYVFALLSLVRIFLCSVRMTLSERGAMALYSWCFTRFRLAEGSF